MENSIIRKRLNTFKSGAGKLTRVSDDVVMEVLRGWESWPGKSVEFQREIGLSKMQLAIMIKKGKKLVKNGVVTESEFKEIGVPLAGASLAGLEGVGMELRLDAGRAIRFSQVDHLVEFLKKTSPT
jgi:hypothetical protein